MDIVKNLNIDLKRKIFNDYFLCIDNCNNFLELQSSDVGQKLEYDKFRNIINKILLSKFSINYLCENNSYFKLSYLYHFIENKKRFKLLNYFDSFILTILMSEYH